MKHTKFISRFISTGVLSLALGTFCIQIAQAQKAIPLLTNTCVNSGKKGSWGPSRQDVSIARELYTTYMYMWNDSAITCRIPSTQQATLRLGFGIVDTAESEPLKISVYLDGNEEVVRTISAGQTSEILLDVSKAKSLAIETSCLRARCYAQVHFYKAQLEPAVSSPGRR
jgi:hypothetical protein